MPALPLLLPLPFKTSNAKATVRGRRENEEKSEREKRARENEKKRIETSDTWPVGLVLLYDSEVSGRLKGVRNPDIAREGERRYVYVCVENEGKKGYPLA